MNSLLIFLIVSLIVYHVQLIKNMVAAIFWGLLVIVVMKLLGNKEGFHFEVTPWKTTCLDSQGKQCAACCNKGFYGETLGCGIGRDSDSVYQNDSMTCAQRKPTNLVNQPSDYENLGDQGGMCVGGCSSGCDYKLVKRAPATKEGYFDGAAAGNTYLPLGDAANDLAGWQNSGNIGTPFVVAKDVETFCGSCAL